MKIFVSVGSMLPFERLVSAMDGWAAAHPQAAVFAQIGHGARAPQHMAFSEMLAPAEFRRRCVDCDLIVSHLGMGTVLTAAELGRPLVALPRRHALREVNSDHQLATAGWLQGRPGVAIVEDAAALGAAIEQMAGRAGPQDFNSESRAGLCAAVADFLQRAVQSRSI